LNKYDQYKHDRINIDIPYDFHSNQAKSTEEDIGYKYEILKPKDFNMNSIKKKTRGLG
jgi:hypothetical protein